MNDIDEHSDNVGSVSSNINKPTSAKKKRDLTSKKDYDTGVKLPDRNQLMNSRKDRMPGALEIDQELIPKKKSVSPNKKKGIFVKKNPEDLLLTVHPV